MTGRILVYDLGGGTFDVSLVELDARTHTVLATEGISTLGGDDFDRVLAELAVGAEALAALDPAAAVPPGRGMPPPERSAASQLAPHGGGSGRRSKRAAARSSIPVADFYERCRPLLRGDAWSATARLAEGTEIDALYVTGGGSELPLVSRMLREEFGRKVKRSEYTRSATAIGLAIQADATSGYTLREVFTRNFGVWRESEAGQRMIFDPIFPRGTRLPAAGEPPLTVSRRYRPVHNIGDFRYLEAGQRGRGRPTLRRHHRVG